MRIPCLAVLGALSLFGITLVQGLEHSSDPAKWEVIPHPKKEDPSAYHEFLYRANRSKHEWVVNDHGAQVAVRLRQDEPLEDQQSPDFDTSLHLHDPNDPIFQAFNADVDPQELKASAFRTLKVSDGWIVAYNQGEFGSAVYWFSEDGKSKKKLSNHQINQILIEGDRIFAVEGIAHLSISEGSMIEIKKEGGEWKVLEFLPLQESAEAIARVGKGDYLVVTSSQLLRVNLDRKILKLIPSADWGTLYPNSVATDGEYAYIGMRQFVVRCRLGKSAQNFEFLAPSAKWLNTKVGTQAIEDGEGKR